MLLSDAERDLSRILLAQPADFNNRFTDNADRELRVALFKSLAGGRDDYLHYFFPTGPPSSSDPWSLRDAQGAIDGAEYLPTAKGTACGHIFKVGENTYYCKTCAADDTCVLCSKCYESSDHEGHMVLISTSTGNSGCCDCGDAEAWKHEVRCTIHTADTHPGSYSKSSGKEKEKASPGSADDGSQLPADLVASIRMTIARSVDYVCDVFSCSPEQLRLPKSETSIRQDERLSRLSGTYGDDLLEGMPEFALVLWNDEKHTVDEVQTQVARACGKSKKFGFEKAMEVNDIGRSIVQYSTDLGELLHMAEVIEQLKVTVTIRSARDTFRENMCSTIIDWISDIANCGVGKNEPYLLRNIVCEELLKPWRVGSQATNKDIGQAGIDDHEVEDNERYLQRRYRAWFQPLRPAANVIRVEVDLDDTANEDEDDENDDEDDEYDEFDNMDVVDENDMDLEVEANFDAIDATDMDIDVLEEANDVTEALEATLGVYRPPMPPPPSNRSRRRALTPADSDDGDSDQTKPAYNAPYENVPATPKVARPKRLRPSKHWLEKPQGFKASRQNQACEDLWQRVRLDFLILYDLRLWKILRINLRHLYITTVVTIPHFKRIIGLRLAGIYTALAQLYLIADREPDHSIINLTVQILTTPSITQEVVERGNFLTNLMAILYTFLTTRQVGFPEDVSMKATLAFDVGAVTNRRIFHFLLDLRWLFQSEFVLYKIRNEPRYLLQFLDLVKLHQGVCPNVRATVEHVEYESDAWISASLIVKEVNKLCKLIAGAFEPNVNSDDGNSELQRAIRTVAQVTMINSFGYERKRFSAAEVKDDLAWHQVGPFEVDGKSYSVPKFVVQEEPISFHHPLHYLLSWLVENARQVSREEMRTLLHFAPEDLKDPFNLTKTAPAPSTLLSDELLSAIFDHPLRTCVWLSQIKASMWVRNGITLRHQAHTYRNVSHRDVGYQRDIFLLQAGLVLCGDDNERPGERFLAQMIDRFQAGNWVKGIFDIIPGFEEAQQLDVMEDFLHLLVIVLSERGNLLPSEDEKIQLDQVLQHDIAHSLCFKPLSFSELASRVTEKVSESDDFTRVLQGMTNFRAPEGLSDTGTFELKPDYIELVDPYYAHYSRNHREEAESILKKHMARKTGRKVEDIVYEPHLETIEGGLFAGLAAFTSTPLFVQLLGAAFRFALKAGQVAPKVQSTRIETFLHMVLHLTTLAIMEDKSAKNSEAGFVHHSCSSLCKYVSMGEAESSEHYEHTSLVKLLLETSSRGEYASCQPAIKQVLSKMEIRQPEKVAAATGLHTSLDRLLGRDGSGSPASLPAEDKERRKQEALARQAKVMAQMKQQQNSFLQNQGLSSYDDDDDDDIDDELNDREDDMCVTDDVDNGAHRKTWSFPTGTCILCQEETNDQLLYGTFAFLGESDILRSTPVQRPEFIKEVIETPTSLDRSAEGIRPFGVSGDNKREVEKKSTDGRIILTERQELSKGFPHQKEGIKGPVATSCGHMMHYNCFDLYVQATHRRHQQQIARNHPERIEHKEFVCPLCKALGNTFLPIIWKAKECAREHELHAAKPFEDWLNCVDSVYAPDLSFLDGAEDSGSAVVRNQQVRDLHSQRLAPYVASMFAPSLVQQNMQDLSLESQPANYTTRRPIFGGTAASLFSRLSGANSNQVQSSSTPSGGETRTNDLCNAYRRIEESIKVNGLGGNQAGLGNAVGAMSRSLGLSITSFEITFRGVCHTSGATTLLADMPEQVLTHLRIMSETIESYLAVMTLPSGPNVIAREAIQKRDILTVQLFGDESEARMVTLKNLAGKLLFQDDVFLFYADWLSYWAPDVAEAASILRICYWAELVKAIFVMRRVVNKQNGLKPTGGSNDQQLKHAIDAMQLEHCDGDQPLDDAQIALLRMILDKYALAFLRKAAVLMTVRYGLDFECPYNVDPGAPELQRMTAHLHMPSLDEICAMFTSQTTAGHKLRTITGRWISQAITITNQESNGPVDPFSLSTSITVPHPAIFELVGLPMNYDILTEEAVRRRCPSTGKEITDPAICLLCGDIFCSQAVCCMGDKGLGGCYQHMQKHGLKAGIFINIKKCMVVCLHGPGSGSWLPAPYLDKHGETDPTLRRHHQLFLNQKRYDKLLRDIWLNHMIPTVISRKMESDINPGGWETL